MNKKFNPKLIGKDLGKSVDKPSARVTGSVDKPSARLKPPPTKKK
ncbi:hypothetical protein PP175_21420 [Aneurinibacillus sp. Ricciae_BoGa-3]|nr:hypothetical protein [Aneurinibacillus sp. Ricciae_BoGa-3]WCK53852.1 hypothetical protein PP175_21420 [Aneurinibacillus sp. Ricciae_BoGa-3]